MIVKICGLKRVEDLIEALRIGSDVVGMIVGVPESPRSNTIAEARVLFEASQGELSKRALLFRSSPFEDVSKALSELQPDVVHLCGKESPEFRSEIKTRFPDMTLWQSVGIPVDDVDDLDWVERVEDLLKEDQVGRVVLDSAKSGKTGGVGKAFPMKAVRRHLGEDCSQLILAGGLKPDNVQERIDFLKPAGVDISSGIESQPGQKSFEQMKLFVDRARG